MSETDQDLSDMMDEVEETVNEDINPEEQARYTMDIETEGLSGDEHRVLVVGFQEVKMDSDGVSAGDHEIFYVNGHDVKKDQLTASQEIHLHPCEDEEDLLDQVNDFVDEVELAEGEMYGYNSTGFDNEFLRTRCSKHWKEWIFRGVTNYDLQRVCKHKANTVVFITEELTNFRKSELKEIATLLENKKDVDINTSVNKDALAERLSEFEIGRDLLEELVDVVDEVGEQEVTTEKNDMDTVYDVLIPDDHPSVSEDPLDGGSEFPDTFAEGDIEDALQHNIADNEKLVALVEWADRYVKPSSPIVALDTVKQEDL